MKFPGKRTLELGVEIRFLRPTYAGDVLELAATVKERLESRQVVVIHFAFRRSEEAVARGKVSIMLCDVG